MRTEIYLVRHAQSDQAVTDAKLRPLTEKDLTDAKRLAGFFRSIPVDLIISSPYLRAYQTVTPLAEDKNLTVFTDERMREWMGGRPFPGEMFESRMERLFSDETSKDGGCESLRSVKKRTGECIMHLLSRHAGKTIAVGTHAIALTAAVMNYKGDIGLPFLFELLPAAPFIAHMTFDDFSLVSLSFYDPLCESAVWGGNTHAI